MDDRLIRDLTIGITGSIIGAFIVFLVGYGFRFTKAARAKSKEKRNAEVRTWQEATQTAQQNITNDYLFTILKYYLIANLFWVFGEVTPEIVYRGTRSEIFYFSLFAIGRILSLLFFFIALGKVLRYMRIRNPAEG
jgi:hypothetical protein